MGLAIGRRTGGPVDELPATKGETAMKTRKYKSGLVVAACPNPTFQRGTRVTAEPRLNYRGEPVPGWPDQQFIMTVSSTQTVSGQESVRCKTALGGTRLYSPKELIRVPDQHA